MQIRWRTAEVTGCPFQDLDVKDRPLVQPPRRTVWRFLKQLEIELPYDPAIPLLGIHTEETRRERDTCTPNVHRSTVYNSQDMEAT